MSPDSAVLFEDGDTVVTPSWLQLGNSSYAIRTIVRLDLNETAPPRTSLTLAFFFSLLLILGSGLHLYRGSLPPQFAWIIFSASLILMLITAWYAFVVPTKFRLDITLADGSQLQVSRASKSELSAIRQALARAMDWHRGGESFHDR